jgi:DNA-binding GntR family transcriptional regulator
MELIKINFRDQIREIILDSILNNQLKSGEKLSLADYARKLETSVTPIREAFTQLEMTGILESIPNVGFCIKSISNTEAEEIYALIGLIESHCLQAAYDTKTMEKLVKWAHKIENTHGAENKLLADNEFHDLLIDKANNPTAYDLLRNLKTRVFLFELQFMLDRNSSINRDHDHLAMVEAIDKGKPVANLLRAHWKNSFKFIIHQNKRNE